MSNIQPPKFRFSFLIRGVLTEVLKNAPEKWDEITLNFSRSDTYKGMVRSLSTPVKFVYDAARSLRREFYKYGILSNVKLLIDRNDPKTWQYKNIYDGKVDFSQFEDDLTGVQLTSGEDDISVKIKANEDTDYAINVDVPEAITVTLSPINLKESADLIFAGNIDKRSDAFFEMRVVNNEQHSTEQSVQDIGFLADPSPNFVTSNEWFYRSTTATTVRIQGHIDGFVIPPPPVQGDKRYQINVYGSDGYKNTLFDVTLHLTQPFSIDFDFTVTVAQGTKLFFYFENVTDDNTNNGFQVNKGNVTLNYTTITVPSTAKSLTAGYVFDKLIQLINGADTGGAYTPYPTQSYLLSQDLRQLVITCSNSIRKIENGTQFNAGDVLSAGSKYQVVNAAISYNSVIYNPGDVFTALSEVQSFTTSDNGAVILISFAEQIVISFKNFFQSIYSVMGGNCSFGIENGVACLENLSYVYRNVQSINLGTNRRGFKLSPAVDLLFNTIKVGYQDPQLDSLNASQAVNSEQTYRVNDMPINKELNLISPISAEALSIEQTRTVPVDSSASRSDNKPYFIWLNEAMTAPLLTNDISGVESGETYYNWYISPKQNLLRGGAYLASIFDKMQGYEIIFTSGLKNVNMSVTIDGRVITENSNIQISNLPSPIFLPYYVDVSTDLKEGALAQIDGIPFGYLSFIYNDAQINGFINEISIDMAQNSTRDFKLLVSPTTDLLGLIK